MDLLHLPIEIFQLVIETTLIQNGLQQALGMRLVCRLFDREVFRAICATKAFHGLAGIGYPKGPRIWSEYLQARVIAPGGPACRLVSIIRDTVDYIIQQRPLYKDHADEYLRSLCAHVCSEVGCGVWTVRYRFTFGPRNPPHDKLERYILSDHVVAASAYLGLTSLLEQLTEHGFHDEDSHFGTPVECAAQRGDVAMTHSLLLKMHGESEVQATSRKNALSVAAKNGDEAMIRLLFGPEYTKLVSCNDYVSAVSSAATGGKLRTVRFLIQHATDGGHTEGHKMSFMLLRGDNSIPWFPLWNTVFLDAAWSGHEDVVRLALNQGANINVSSKFFPGCRNALDGAAKNGHAHIVDLLLSKGAVAWPAKRCHRMYHCHPLYYAARGGWLRIARTLIDYGVDIDQFDDWHPLEAAASGGHVDVVRMLLERGADVTINPTVGRKAYSIAESRGFTGVMVLLAEYGLKIVGKDSDTVIEVQ
ncbi:ankyrin [Lophium mytilinum]|uniref:Ankyrin n=1 Tax=Lophium mytilinum TaxID=390894 RepID=A0A6A6R485_9PEZI|nr:ankyrin [Lophium mytilinum]